MPLNSQSATCIFKEELAQKDLEQKKKEDTLMTIEDLPIHILLICASWYA